MKTFIFIILSCLFSLAVNAQTTEIQYLSGSGYQDTKTWEFYCSAGMNSGKWSKIEVPSQWELQGFGEYTYGRFYLNKELNPAMKPGYTDISSRYPLNGKICKSVLFLKE